MISATRTSAKVICSPTQRRTPPPTVFINSHHCLADTNQLPWQRGRPNWNREKVGVFRFGVHQGFGSPVVCASVSHSTMAIFCPIGRYIANFVSPECLYFVPRRLCVPYNSRIFCYYLSPTRCKKIFFRSLFFPRWKVT